MAVINVEGSKVISQGKAFVEYSESLNALLGKINENVEVIGQNGIQGSAAAALMTHYESIHATIRAYAGKIHDLGELIQASAKAKANVDEASAKAAGGHTL